MKPKHKALIALIAAFLILILAFITSSPSGIPKILSFEDDAETGVRCYWHPENKVVSCLKVLPSKEETDIVKEIMEDMK